MRNIFILLIVIFSQELYSQDIIKKIDKIYKSEQILEEYYVLEGFENIKHGQYISYYKIAEIDYQKNNKNDSIRVKQIGQYYYNAKLGYWTYYDKPEKNGNVIERGKINAKGKYMFDMKYGLWQETDEKGVFQTKDYKIYLDTANIKFDLSYPFLALEIGVSGDVIIGFELEKDCSINSINFINEVGYGIDKESFLYILTNPKNYPCDNKYIIDTVRFRLK